MVFLILDQICPLATPQLCSTAKEGSLEHPPLHPDVHLVRTITAWWLFPGACWKVLEAWLV